MLILKLKSTLKNNKTTIALVVFSFFLYFLLASQIPRIHFWVNLGLYCLLFGSYLVFNSQKLNWKLILGIGVLFRVVFLFFLPELSDDFYRFYWDGLQSVSGTSPFAYLPSEITNPSLDAIYTKLNSQNYYSVYPGVNQLIYLLGVFLGRSLEGFVLTLKVLMVFAELVSFYFLYLLLQYKKKSLNLLSWYFLNPLVILEFVGNLHFEGFMLSAFLGSLYLLSKKEILGSSIYLGLACAIKIMPFIFIPLYFTKVEKAKSWLVLFVPPIIFMMTLVPFYHVEMFQHINDSIQLYFGEFEFNSSFFLLFAWIGVSKVFLKVLLLLGLGIVSYCLYQKTIDLELALVWLFTLYLLLSQSIHPWYVAGFLGVAVLNKQRYVVLWTFLIFLTYITYQKINYEQKLWVNVVEYSVVMIWFWLDIKKKISAECNRDSRF